MECAAANVIAAGLVNFVAVVGGCCVFDVVCSDDLVVSIFVDNKRERIVFVVFFVACAGYDVNSFSAIDVAVFNVVVVNVVVVFVVVVVTDIVDVVRGVVHGVIYYVVV